MNRKTRLLALITAIISILAILPSFCDTPLTDDGVYPDKAPAVTQISDGKIWVVWQSYITKNFEIFYKTSDGSSWSSDKQLTNHTYVDALPSIIETKDGTIWVVWTSNRAGPPPGGGQYDIFYKTSSDGGSTWSEDTPLTNDPDTDLDPSIVQLSTGEMWIVWQSRGTGNYDLFYKSSSDGGLNWSDKTPLTTDLNDDKHPTIIQALDGKIWVVWASNRTVIDDLFYKTSSDGGLTWSVEEQLTTASTGDTFPSIMQTEDGDIWVAWQASNFQVDIHYKVYNGSSWSPESKLTWLMDEDIMPSLFQAWNGTIWLVWASDKLGNFDIYYKFVIVDLAIYNVTTSSNLAAQGDLVDIHVDVLNQGTIGVVFDITPYYGNIPIKTTTETLLTAGSGIPIRYTLTWNTTGVPYGFYDISTTVSTYINENDLTDNSFRDGTVMVTIPGDVNGDRKVDIYDGSFISSHWYPGPPIGPLGYDMNADINNDGRVDIYDVGIINLNWQKSW